MIISHEELANLICERIKESDSDELLELAIKYEIDATYLGDDLYEVNNPE